MTSLIRRQRARPCLGTFVEISVDAESVGMADEAIAAAFAKVELVQNLMSYHDPLSEISTLNRTGQVKASLELRHVLAFCKEVYGVTGGLVNVAVAPVLAKYGYLPKFDRDFVLGSPLDYLIEGENVILKRPIAIDLGGVAKGFAVDQAIAELKRQGIPSAIVIAGGDLRAYGELREFFLRHPTQPSLLEPFLAAEDIAMATSASYFSNPESHEDRLPYVDRAGECLKHMPSVTVVAPQCMVADALTKYFLLGKPTEECLNFYSAKGLVREQ